jgi:uncharacterized protein
MPSARSDRRGRRAALKAVAAAGCAALLPRRARAEDAAPRFLRIGTANVTGTYFAIGGLIADIVSRPPGAPCDGGGSCGVPGLTAVAQSSTGSVANVEAIQAGEIESGFAQSDVAYAAFTATGPFEGKAPADRLRALASLYHEFVHLVVRADSDLHEVADLKGRRVSLDADGSGSIVDARLVLAAFGLAEGNLEASYTPLAASVDRMRDGELDAFFLTAGWPAPAVAELAGSVGVRLIPVAGPQADTLVATHRFLTRRAIPAGAYPGVQETPTIAVGAEWLVDRDLPDELVYALATALWSPNARAKLDAGHPRGKVIRLETALEGVAIPLHPGAERYYREHGVLR